MTRDEAIAWTGTRASATEKAKDLAELELDRLMRFGPLNGDDGDKAAKASRRVGLLIRAVASWVRLGNIWRAGLRARLKVSFSGGRTSGWMAKLIKERLSHLFELVFVFANTGREHNKTLIFVDRCDKAYGLDVKWLEGVVHHDSRESTTHRVVTFETASRLEHGDWNPNGWPTPFLEVVKKYGIPNYQFEPCNREMKLNTMNSFMESIGWYDYYTAIGIRADEPSRLDETAAAFQIIHFLADPWASDKQDVMCHWEGESFDLDLEEYLGNCVDCHKKSKRKLFMAYAAMPEVFEFDLRIEEEFAWHGAPYHGVPTEGGKPRKRWRGEQSTKELIAEARAAGVQPHIPIKDMRSMKARQFGFDFESGSCSESCEAYPLELAA